MGIFRQFPYSNFHEMNMDQLLKIMREMQEEWAATKEEWASYKDFIDNYFNTLDISAEVLEALREMAATGELNTVMDPVIASETAEWLSEHITPTSPIVDSSLTIAGAAADAKATGDAVDAVEKKLDSNFDQTNNILHVYDTTIGLINSSGNVVGDSGRTSNFIKCEPETTYYPSRNYGVPTNSFPYVVGFYNSNKSFISRLVNTQEYNFTTPAGTAFLRISLRNSTDQFTEDMQLTKNGIYPYEYSTEVLSETPESPLVEKLKYKVLGITEDDIWPLYINASNKWIFNNNYHICIPIKENDSITIVANKKQPCVYAMLTSNRWRYQEAPDFVNTYNIVIDENGNINWDPVLDENDEPVKDTRHSVIAKNTVSFTAVPNSAYLYIYARSSSANYIPESIVINDQQYIIDESKVTAAQAYETILFDDFNDFDTNVWKRLTVDPPNEGRYNSRFYTTADNAWCEQSMLVLKCYKPDTEIDLGTYLDHSGTEQDCEYAAPYISTEDSYVIPSGRISARIKTNQNMGAHFPWCFWTFGQGANWGYAHEMDIIEQTHALQITEAESQNGTVVTIGSIKNILGDHTHAKNIIGENITSDFYYNISANIKNDDVYSAETELSNTLINIDPTEWHTYTVDWNTNIINYYLDGVLMHTVNAAKIGAVDENNTTGFHHPQDLRFNIKAEEWSELDEALIFVDWVRIERIIKQPALTINHSDINLSVGDSVYINPVFNNNCSNKAFSVEVTGDAVTYEKYLNDDSKMVAHKITGAEAGTSNITITSANNVVTGTFEVTVS